MKRPSTLLFGVTFLLLSIAGLPAQTLQQPVQPVNIIIDSDMAHNVDDIGDHAMMWALAARGEANVLALIIDSTNDYSAACAQAVAQFYGHASVPIGAYQGTIPNDYAANFSYYTQQVAQAFGYGSITRFAYPQTTTVYRQALVGAADHSVYIIAGGFYQPLMQLLQSPPDSISPLTGMQLVSQKVKQLVVASGIFPDSETANPGNMSVDPDGASYVIANWPGEIVFMPDDEFTNLSTGPSPAADDNTNPVKLAYDLYCSYGSYCSGTSGGWMQAGLLWAIRGGLGVNFSVGGRDGSTVVWDSTTAMPGRTVWTQTPNRQHSYLKEAIPGTTMEGIINPLIQWIPPGPTAPVANPQSLSTPGLPLAILLSGSDSRQLPLTYTVVSQPSHGSLDGTPPHLTYTPATGYVGGDGFAFSVSNGTLNSSAAVVSITVTALDTPPVAISQTLSSTGVAIPVTLTGGDPDGDTLTFRILTQPSHGSLAGTPPELTYTPQPGFNGTDSFTFSASDGHSDSPPATITIVVSPRPYRLRLNAGGLSITDSAGNVWQADRGYDGGYTYSTAAPITAAVGDPRLYQTQRYGTDSLVYTFSNLTNGTYEVNLYFAELYSGCFQANCRVFNVLVQGNQVLTNFEPFVAAGGGNIGVARSTRALVTSGTLTITFQAGLTQYPTINAIEVALLPANSSLYGSISGTVTHGGNPAPGALVSSAVDYAITDNAGAYTLAQLLPGPYAVTAAGGELSSTRTVNVTAGATTTADFALTSPLAPVANPQSVTAASLPIPIVLTGTDPQGLSLTYTVATQPAHGSLAGSAPNLTYTPASGYVGPDSFTFRVSDGTYSSNPATVSITVTPPNSAPVANPQSVASSGGPIPITLTATDPQGWPLTYVLTALPAYGTLTGTPPNLTYTPQTGYIGADSFTFRANDGMFNSNVATVSISIGTRPYRLRVNAGGPSVTDASGNAWQADGGYDGGSEYSTTSPISAMVGDPTMFQTQRYGVDSLQYNFTDLPNGTYAVNLYFAELYSGCFHANCRVFNVLVQGNQVLTSFEPYVAAGGGNIGVARSASAVVSNGTLNITLQAALTQYPAVNGIELILLPPNDAQFGSISGTVTLSGTTTPVAGALVSSSIDSAITDNNGGYTLAQVPPGTYTLTASASGGLNSTLTVNVTAGATTTANLSLSAPQPPVANPQSVTTPNVPIAIVLTGTDPHGASLTYTVATQPAHGTLTGTAPNLTYTPSVGYVGADSFTFRVNNGTYDSAPATVSITVTAAILAPVANSQTVGSSGGPTPITLTATDPNGLSLTYSVVTQPAHGTLTGAPPNLTYTPQTGYTGADTFTFLVNNGTSNSNVATVSITVSTRPFRLRVNPGGPSVTDDHGNVWQADTGFDGGYTYSTLAPISSMVGDPTMFQTQRYGTDSLQYNFTGLTNGTYAVNLYFAELYDGCFHAHCRVFNVLVQGNQVLTNFEPYVAAGGGNVGIARSATAAVSNGTLNITLRASQTEYPTINGIELVLLPANTAQYGSISGTVTQASNAAAVPGALVTTSLDFAITDNNGAYTIAQLPPGTYPMVASSPNLAGAQTVMVTGGATTTANFLLASPQPPVANPQSVTTPGVPVSIVLTGSDPQGASLTYTVVTAPAHGALSGTIPNLVYTPTAGYAGADAFTFTVNNGILNSNPATVSITVTAAILAPVANEQTVTSSGGPTPITLTGADSNGLSLTYRVLTQPSHGTLAGTAPNLTYTPQAGYTGTDSFTFRVNNGYLDSAAATVTILVSARPFRMRVNAGGPTMTDAAGNVWQADTGYNNGSNYSTTSPISVVAGDPTMYQTQRYSATSLQYGFNNLPNGNYAVNLYFAELYSGCFHAGCRVFNVLVQGNQVLTNFDPYVAAGAGNTGVARSASAVVSDGTLNITLQATLAQFPAINGIELLLLPANSSQYGSISGTVAQSGTSAPIPGALVSAAGSEIAITDNNGAYTLAQFLPGSYPVTAASPGAQTSTQSVTVVAGATTTANFTLSVAQPPVANPQSVTTSGLPLSITLTGSDPQGRTLTYTVLTQPAHGALSGTAPDLTYTPSTGFVGSDSFTFRASNGTLDSPPATVSITVTTLSHPPVANSQSVTASGPTPITLTATDLDGDPLTFTVVTPPVHGTLTGAPPNLTYTPQAGYTGTDSFQFLANDGLLNSAVATVTITVSTKPYRLRVNPGGPAITDADGNLWQADRGYDGGSTLSTASTVATIAGNPAVLQTQRYSYDSLQYTFTNLPNGNYAVNLYFAELHSGCFQAGCRVFNVLVQGNQVLTNFDPYTAAGGGNIGVARSSGAVVSDGTLTILLQAGLTAYPVINGIELAQIPSNSSQYGSISGTVTQAGTGTPIPGALVSYSGDWAITDNNGVYTLPQLQGGSYTVTAAVLGSQNSTSTITVTAGATTTVNFVLSPGQGPVANPQSVTTPGAPLPIVLTGSDPQGLSLTYRVLTSPAHGALSGTAPNLTYTPFAGYVGADSFTFRVSNGTVDSAPATVSISVTAANLPPVANSQTVNALSGAATPVTLTATASSGLSLTFTVLTQPAHGSLAGTAPNLTYTPQTGYTGTDSFTFQASDGQLTSAAATVSIVVSTRPYSLHVNSGGSAFTDANGNSWVADTGSNGGLAYSTTSTITTAVGEPSLFQTERYAENSLQYNFTNLPNGTYAVNLYFAEIAANCFHAGCRVFNVLVQGNQVLTNFDPYAAAGGENIGIARSATAVVSNGTLNITLQASLTPYPTISGIELILLTANSSGYGSISGTVTRAGTGTPIAGALVAFSGNSAITANDGAYTLVAVPPGTYTVAASSGGAQSATSSVTVTAGSTTTANFSLSPAP